MAKGLANTTKKLQKPSKASGHTKKRNFLLPSVIALLIIAGFSWWIFNIWKQQKKVERLEENYSNAFRVSIPASYTIHGIDVSTHQSNINWQKVAAMKVNNVSVNFSFIKSTEGIDSKDDFFYRNYTQAKSNGLITGAYHFFIATKSGALQAKNYIRNTPLSTGDLPPVVDIENLYGASPNKMRARLYEYLQAIEAKYKVKPIIYTYIEFYENYLGDQFKEYPLWVAHYEEPEKPRIEREWMFWQHSKEGHVNGIQKKVDMNVFYGDSSLLQKILIP